MAAPNFQGMGLIDGFLALRDHINERKFMNSPEFKTYMNELTNKGTVNPDLARRAGKYPGVDRAVQLGFQGPRERSSVALSDEQTRGLKTDTDEKIGTAKVLGMPLSAFNANTDRKRIGVEEGRLGLDQNTAYFLSSLGLPPSPEGVNAMANQQNAQTAQGGLDIARGRNANEAVDTVLRNSLPLMMGATENQGFQDLVNSLQSVGGDVGGIFKNLATSQAAEKARKEALLNKMLTGGAGATPNIAAPTATPNPFDDPSILDAFHQVMGAPTRSVPGLAPGITGMSVTPQTYPGVPGPQNVNDFVNALTQINQSVMRAISAPPATTREGAQAYAKEQAGLNQNVKALLSLVQALQQTGTPIPPDVQNTLTQLRARGVIR